MDEFNPKDYWETRLKKSFGLDGVGHIGLGKHYNHWLYKMRRRVFIRAMKSTGINFHGVEVLDVGSGTCFYIDRWKELGVKRIIGTDITNIAIEELKRQYPGEEFYQINIGGEITSIENRKFDIVSAFDVLFHIVDDARFEKAIQNIYSMLKPGGLFVFSDNFLHGETIRATLQVSRSLNAINKTLNDAGFKIVERTPMSVFMNYPVDSRSHVWQKCWRIMARIVSILEFFGFLLGAILYPVELICVAAMKESPTTEMMICRKPV